MGIRTILVPLDGSEASKPALETAFMVGRDLAANVKVLHMRADPKDAVPLLGEGMSGTMIEEMIELAETEAAKRAARARAMFDGLCAEHGIAVVDKPDPAEKVSASWTEDMGREDEATAWRGRLVDLIVVGRPTSQSEGTSVMTLNAALFETGRPVLVAPPSAPGAPGALGRKVAISWNGSAQAARAVSAALPLITRADGVVILTVESDRTSASAAPELAAYLAWYGVKVETKTFAATDRAVGAELLKECADAG
ncbi:MAG: universal stress protein, partial [Alphaproteobacteria bacterium]|nr:universal stress protein [Alphaproteobacteria bacterium]